MGFTIEPKITLCQELKVPWGAHTVGAMLAVDPRVLFARRLNEALDGAGVPEKGKGRQVKVAKMFGVSQKGARKWLEGEAIPNTKRIAQIAARLEVAGEWLLTGQGEMRAPSAQLRDGDPARFSRGGALRDTAQFQGAPVTTVPILSWGQAGKRHEETVRLVVNEDEKSVSIAKDVSPNSFALLVRGDSMQAIEGPSFPPGSIIIVDPAMEAQNESFVVVRVKGADEASFKQLVIDGGRTYLKPLNPRYPVIEAQPDATICGVVRQMLMDFG